MTTAYRERVIDGLLRERLQSSGAVVLEGPKACGKTFTAEQHAASRVYLDQDDAAMAALDVDPALVLSGAAPQLVDEWQLAATRVWNHVRAQVNQRGLPGQYILTGSAVPVDDDRRHTGAGRFAHLRMRPMSLFESGQSTGAMSLTALMAGERPTAPASGLTVPDLADLVVRGGWPLNLPLSTAAAARANADYLRTTTEVDIPRVDTRRDPQLATRLMGALARNTAMELKVARLVAAVSAEGDPVARSTAYTYLSVLERLMLIENQPAWSTHLRSRARLRTAPRTHFVDPSLAAAALQAGPDRLLGDLETLGLLFESLVVRDLRVYGDALDAEICHYRDSNGAEVDAIVQTRGGQWGAFEVKLGSASIDAWAAKLLKFASDVDTDKAGPPAVLAVITGTGYGYTRPDGVVVVPIGTLGP
ncbi:DUF4143 domain-containing protein [Cellulomonas cellasea]|uniref:ATP-binding protein n=1 Tax=Cellulomonas cellasea TaxID=43670 RepID=UPI0025A40B33|nr:DUF4143 domain-containing protein [Cellulomonas cellasea]MDM8085327.1 DUF4143 domain-containing protein [Cellulomonas cellasea]